MSQDTKYNIKIHKRSQSQRKYYTINCATAEIIYLWECSNVVMMKCDKDKINDDKDDSEEEE